MIRLIVIGKPTREYATLIHEYEKRLPKYCRFEVLELKDEIGLLERIKGRLVALDRQGIQLASEGIAELLKASETITFAIGGDTGLSAEVKKKASVTISFGKVTFPHQLARLMLTEQIYRAFTIIKGEKYHK